MLDVCRVVKKILLGFYSANEKFKDFENSSYTDRT
jgi:hypothetical protein